MKKLFVISLFLNMALSTVEADECARENGDANADASLDIGDVIYLLSHLYLGKEPPAPICERPCFLPDTGQTRCYDTAGNEISCSSSAYPGQDGFYRVSCRNGVRFADNGDGTVTDNCTGLMWQKDYDDVYYWQEALQYCDALDFAGYTDWRLPNIRELQSIIDYGRYDPATDPVFGPVPHWFWSSSTNEPNPIYAWLADFRLHSVSDIWLGNVYSQDKNVGYTIRAVRSSTVEAVECAKENGDVNADSALDIADVIYLLSHLFLGKEPPASFCERPCFLPDTGQTRCYDTAGNEISCSSSAYPGQDGFYRVSCQSEVRFVDNGDGTVTDNCTGLMWQKDYYVYSWQEALQYCDALDFAGYTDWRLPNIRELHSIIDYGRYDPATDPVFGPINDLFDFFWSSSTNDSNPIYAWGVYFWFGSVYCEDKNEEYIVRAVRSLP